MKRDEIKRMVMAAIQEIAPEIEESDIEPDEELREECDIDSMDFLKLLGEIKKVSGINIPETDYFQVNTLERMIGYLGERLS